MCCDLVVIICRKLNVSNYVGVPLFNIHLIFFFFFFYLEFFSPPPFYLSLSLHTSRFLMIPISTAKLSSFWSNNCSKLTQDTGTN